MEKDEGDGMEKGKVDRSHYLFDNKALRALILPLVVEQLLAVLVGMADSIMIANVGEAAVSGVSLGDNIMVLFINVFAALATGGAVIAGQYLGQKRTEQACRASTQIVWFILLISLAIMALIYFGKGFILNVVFGHIDADVMHHADVYLMIVTASIPFIALYNAGAAIFRAMGNSKVSMQVSVLMNIINVCGNAVLIYGFHRGAEGVAIPTLVSRMVAAFVIIGLLSNQKLLVHIDRTLRYRPDGRMIRRILSIGVPNGLENSMFQLGKILVLSLVSGFGTASIAANAVSNSVCSFAILGGMSMGYALSSVSAQCVGAGDYRQVRYYTRKLMGYSYASMLAMNLLIVAVLSFIIKIYNLSPETGKMAEEIILYHAVCSVLIWPVAFTLPNTLRAANDVGFCMIISVASMWIFRIGMSFVLSKNFGMGVFGVWVAMTIDWVVRAIFFAFRYRGTKWEKAKV